MNDLFRSLPALESQLEDAEREAQDAQRRADALRKIIEGVRALHGEAGQMALAVPLSADPEDGPRGREAIRLIVTERPGIWTIPELSEEMRRRGWFSTRKAVEVAVHRLIASGEAERMRTGVFRFPPEVIEEADAA
jgi:hypothetical protein